MKHIQPIIVTGAPRSGTTLTMRILHAAGMQLGQVAEQNELREGRIREELYKPILSQYGYDPLAQTDLPPPAWYPQDWDGVQFRDAVFELAQVADLTKPWGFKAIKGLLFWPLVAEAFPGAKWLIVCREREEHISSLLRTPFMKAHNDRDGWSGYLDQIDAHLDSLVDSGLDVDFFWPDTVRDGLEEPVKVLCEDLGLKFNDSCMRQFNPHLYRK